MLKICVTRSRIIQRAHRRGPRTTRSDALWWGHLVAGLLSVKLTHGQRTVRHAIELEATEGHRHVGATAHLGCGRLQRIYKPVHDFDDRGLG